MSIRSARRSAAPAMTCRSILALAASAAALATAHAADYGTFGSMYVGTTEGYANPVFPEIPPVAQLAERAQAPDAAGGSKADAALAASLASALLVTHAAASADPADVYGAGAVAMVEPVSFKDRLTFIVPAGEYANDLRLRLSGYASGSLQAVGCQNGVPNNCSNGYQVVSFHVGGSYGAQDYFRRIDVNAEGKDSDLLNESFTLDIRLLPAGSFASNVSVDVAVAASMIARGSAANTYSYPFGASATLFSSDFEAAFTGLDVTGVGNARARAPGGITWTSASGVFLSQPVPEPGTWAMMAFGGLVLALVVRRRRPPPC